MICIIHCSKYFNLNLWNHTCTAEYRRMCPMLRINCIFIYLYSKTKKIIFFLSVHCTDFAHLHRRTDRQLKNNLPPTSPSGAYKINASNLAQNTIPKQNGMMAILLKCLTCRRWALDVQTPSLITIISMNDYTLLSSCDMTDILVSKITQRRIQVEQALCALHVNIVWNIDKIYYKFSKNLQAGMTLWINLLIKIY